MLVTVTWSLDNCNSEMSYNTAPGRPRQVQTEPDMAQVTHIAQSL